jgi:antitoxin VapB
MAMNIKNPEAERLAREVAALEGISLTTAVTEALRQRLVHLRRESKSGLAERLLAIGKECAPLFAEPYRSAPHGDLLYDERGLPK